MQSRAHPAIALVFLLIVAPIGAAVVVAALLLFGVAPHTVFALGLGLKAFLKSHGLPAPNAVGVLTTTAMWWLIIVAAGFAWSRWRARKLRLQLPPHDHDAPDQNH